MIRWPNEDPENETSTIVITANTPSVSRPRSPLSLPNSNRATRIDANQSMNSATILRPNRATEPGPASGRPSRYGAKKES